MRWDNIIEEIFKDQLDIISVTPTNQQFRSFDYNCEMGKVRLTKRIFEPRVAGSRKRRISKIAWNG